MPGILVSLVAFILSGLLFGFLPVTLVAILYQALEMVGMTVVLGVLATGTLLFYGALAIFRRSLWKALIDLFSFGVFFIGWLISKFATAVRRVGLVITLTSALRNTLNLYPGRQFARNRREEIAERAIKYYERGDVEIDDSAEKIVREIQEEYSEAGRRLSNGESVLALALAGITILPSNSNIVPYASFLNSQTVGAVLSVGLVLVVALRLSALDMALVKNPSPDDHIARLATYRDWNQTLSSGVEVINRMLMFRLMYGISDLAYDFYIDWVFDKNFNGHGAGHLDVFYELRKPIFCFTTAQRRGISPTEASQERYGRNVFADFNFGPGRDESTSHSHTTNTLDRLLEGLIEFRQELKVHSLAAQENISLEEASMKIYGENIFPADSEEENPEEVQNLDSSEK